MSIESEIIQVLSILAQIRIALIVAMILQLEWFKIMQVTQNCNRAENAVFVGKLNLIELEIEILEP